MRTGEVPGDPHLIAAAIRYGTVVQAYQRRTSRAERAVQWLGPVVAITYGIFELVRLPPQYGVLLIVVGLWWVVQSVLRLRRRRRTFHNLEALRAAADPDMASGNDDDIVAGLPPWRFRLVFAAMAIPVVAFMALVYLVIRADPDCYYVAGAANLIHDQHQLMDPQNMTRGQPDLAAYRRWAHQLRDYADHTTDPRLAPGLHRIAELADQIVAQFAQSRDAMVKQPPGYDLSHQEKVFSATAQKLLDEDAEVFAICFPHH